MVNQIGGKNYKKGKKGGRKTKNPTNQFDTSAGQYLYGQVISKLGHNRLAVKLQTGIEIQAVIPGRFMKKVWFNKEDYVVVQCNDNKFYDVVQKVTSSHIMSKATIEMREKVDNDNKDLYDPFNQKQDSDDENEAEELTLDEYDNNAEKQESQELPELNDNINNENDESEEDSDEDNDEDLVKNNNSNLPLDNFENDSQDNSEDEPEIISNNPQKVSSKYLFKKQQNKQRDIDKRNRQRVFTDFNKSNSENSNSEEEPEIQQKPETTNMPIPKKKNKIDITKLIFKNQVNNQVNNQPTTNVNNSKKVIKSNYVMTDEEKIRQILDFMS